MLSGCCRARRRSNTLTNGGDAGKPDCKSTPDGSKPKGQISGRLSCNHPGESHDENRYKETIDGLSLRNNRKYQTLSKTLFMLGRSSRACSSGDALANGRETRNAHRKATPDGGEAGRLGRCCISGQKTGESHDENGYQKAINCLRLGNNRKYQAPAHRRVMFSSGRNTCGCRNALPYR